MPEPPPEQGQVLGLHGRHPIPQLAPAAADAVEHEDEGDQLEGLHVPQQRPQALGDGRVLLQDGLGHPHGCPHLGHADLLEGRGVHQGGERGADVCAVQVAAENERLWMNQIGE